ncbi:aldehyde dehydrogenase family 3 member F1-like isoform X1 [Lycium barbarum]|uniref:aldehyde dehydrogenase family 3 member F1-like isoform X1 n=1 Tax=Lycium barbarum TaxID=112863 RepID=UPI00293F74DE|nr:aldehyde dehydrogenase family 3 member F1-like isoform X1 [Lycium barbarum]
MSECEKDLEVLRETFKSGKTREESWRRSQLKNLLRLLEEKEDDIFKALKQDLGKHQVEAYRDEIGTLVKSVNYALDGLKQWMSSKKAKLPIAAFPSSAELVPEPLGLVLIISSWNFPFGVSLEPLIGAIAAGNVMVLKPSELAPACSSVLAKTIPTYLDSKAIKVIEGDYSVGQKLLQQKWDKIFFTGSTKVAQIVMAAAAKHLTPVTLELGGKCPAIIDSLSSSWDKNIAMKRILSGKFGTCAGQVCAGIDYILVKKTFANELVQMIKFAIPKMFGENPKESHSMSRIVNKTHFLRIKNLLDEPMVKASIIYGGSTDEDNLYIEPTLLLDPPVQAAIMTEEIFGPLLPILTMDNIEDSIEFINAKPKPLAIYAFTKDEELRRKIISRTSSGSVVFNDTIIQYAADTLPFGGVGQSGFGRYHGKFSFDTFSHEKVVVRRSFLTDIWFRYPPWNDHKLQLFRVGFRYDYLSIVLITLGLKKA